MPAQPPPPGKKAFFLTPATTEKLIDLLDAPPLEPDPKQFEVQERGGKRHFRYREPGRPGSPSGRGSHPFQLSVAGGDLSVEWGLVEAARLHSVVAGVCNVVPNPIDVLFNSYYLANNPFGYAAGVEALSPSTTYGVWLVVTFADSDLYMIPPVGGVFWYARQASAGAGAQIVVDTTYVDWSQTLDFKTSLADDEVGHFIGKIVVDEDGVAVIQQFRFSDIYIPLATFHE